MSWRESRGPWPSCSFQNASDFQKFQCFIGTCLDFAVGKDKGFDNSTKKRQHYFDILKAFFVRHSSEYKTSESDPKVNRNIYPDAVTRDRMRLIDPKSGQLEPIHHCCLVEEL